MLGWFIGRIPQGWFTAGPEVTRDREEILVVGELDEPELPRDAEAAARAAALEARVRHFREEMRAARIGIAEEAGAGPGS